MPDYGIDVSGFNTITNWAAARGVGNAWMWSKATQGSGYTNPQFASQIAGARAAGLLVGAYHFPDPNVSVAANVAHFVAVANASHALDSGCFLPLLDMEDDPADGIVWTAASANAFVPAFRDEFRRQSGVHQLCVYGSESWFAAGKLNPSLWMDDGLFLAIAQYTDVPGQVSWTHPRAAVHQYTDSAPTPGAAGVTDRSCTLGSWTAGALTIGSATARGGGNNMATFIKNVETGQYATQDGPLVSGIAETTGEATLKAWPGASCEIGLSDAEFQDRVRKSQALEGLAAAIAALPAAIAEALPVGSGGAGLTAAQITDAVAAGVQKGLDGVTETSVLHKPAN
jgi:lysozyme